MKQQDASHDRSSHDPSSLDRSSRPRASQDRCSHDRLAANRASRHGQRAGTGGAARRIFGATGRQVALIGQGTWQMEREPSQSIRALRHGIALGATHVDTAELYGAGEVETLVGKAIRGSRADVYLVSKVDPMRATKEGIVRACEGSLRRLSTDYLDLYLLHWLPPHPLEESVEGMERLVSHGKIRHWGVSNFDEVKLAELIAIAGSGRVACNQVMHHLEQRSIEHAVVPFCRLNGLAVVGYSPFGAGRFPPPGSSEAGAALREAAAQTGATARQVALAFLLHCSGGFTIPKASREEHVEENLGAGELSLPPEVLERLDGAFPLGEHAGGIHTW